MSRKKKDNTELNSDPVITDNIDFYFIEFCKTHNIKDIYKVPNLQFMGALIYINTNYIKPNRIIYNGAIDGYRYNLFTIDCLADRYIYMCYIYNQPLSLLGFSHLSGVGYEYICRWKNNIDSISIDISNFDNSENVNIYNNYMMTLPPGKKVVTISYKSIYEKLITNQVKNADLLAIQKTGVNSIAYANRVHDRHDNRKDNQQPVFDILSVAETLGISDKIQSITDKKGQ